MNMHPFSCIHPFFLSKGPEGVPLAEVKGSYIHTSLHTYLNHNIHAYITTYMHACMHAYRYTYMYACMLCTKVRIICLLIFRWPGAASFPERPAGTAAARAFERGSEAGHGELRNIPTTRGYSCTRTRLALGLRGLEVWGLGVEKILHPALSQLLRA